MDHVENTNPPVEGENGGIAVPPNTQDNNELKINQLIEKQLKAFQDTFITQFNEEYKDKLSKLQNDNLELEEKKQKFIISEELRTAGLDGSLIEFVYDKDIEVSKLKISQLKELVDAEAEKKVNERIKEFAYTPPTNVDGFSQNKEKPKYFL